MGLFTRTSGGGGGISAEEVGLLTAVVTVQQTGDFTELDRRCISLLRDELPRLSPLDETTFSSVLDSAINRAKSTSYSADLNSFINTVVSPVINTAPERKSLYGLVYVLAMTDLNINQGEQTLMQIMRTAWGPDQTPFDQAEEDILTRFQMLFRGIAGVSLGLMVVSADGKAQDAELQDLRSARNVLEPLKVLDDAQFNLVFDLALTVHDRFLLDVSARKDFLEQVVANLLQSPDVRYQTFHYAAHIATADGDIAQSEVDMLRDVLHALGMRDEAGDAIFEQYMSRVQTIDGKPK
jgi:tellurite resistance protein